jgi:Ca2+-binding RTX toxin-like protein
MNLTPSQITSFQAGLGAALTNLQSQLASSVFAESLPIIGTNLAGLANQAQQTPGNAGTKKIAALKSSLDSKLAALSSGGSDTAVLKAVNDALKEQGFTQSAKLIGGTTFLVDFSDVTGSGSFSVGVASDLGMPGLDLDLTQAATAKGTANYDFNFRAGLDAGNAFAVEQTEGAEVTVGIDLDAGAFKNVAATMGDVPYLVTAADPNLLNASFALNLGSAGNLLNATVQSGNATPKLNLLTNFGAGTAMPGVGSKLEVNWDLTGATLDADPNNVNFGAVPEVSFNNIGLDPGQFLTGVAGSFFSNITSYIKPIIGIADKLAAPIPGIGPILNQLGLGGTFIDIIAGADSPTAKAVKQIAEFGKTVDAINVLAKTAGSTVDFGSFAFTTDGGGLDIRNDAFSLGSVTPQITNTGTGAAASNSLGKLSTKLKESLGDGLSLPILEGNGELFKFILGQPADLIKYNPGAIVAELPDYGISFPVFPGVNVGATVGASVTFNLEFGFDTRGITDFAQGGFSDATQLLNGLFLTDFRNGPTEIPEASFQMRIGATASIGIPSIAEGGVEGGIRGTINADFKNDFQVPGHPELANDGKLSFQEISKQFQSSVNPLNLFDISGRIEAYLAAYLEFLFYSKRFDLGAFTIFDFEAEKAAAANTPSPILAEKDNLGGTSIQVNVGPRAGNRIVGADGDLGESIRIRPVFDENGKVVAKSVVVSSITTTSLDSDLLPSLGGDVTLNGTELVALAGGGADVFRVSDDVTLPLNLLGQGGNDFIQGGSGKDQLYGGEGADQVFGGFGNDTLTGDAGEDQVYGGGGNDSMIGGAGDDQLFGDEGNDIIYGGGFNETNDTGNDSLYGGDGKDKLYGTEGDDYIDGGAGADTMDGGGGSGMDIFIVDHPNDKIVNAGPNSEVISRTAFFALPDNVFKLTLGTTLSQDGTEVLEQEISGDGNDLDNRVNGNNAANTIRGLGGADDLLGFDGNDTIEGGTGEDYLEGSLGDDYLDGGEDNDLARGGSGNDTLIGGPGDDTLEGDDGDDFLAGGPGMDTLKGGNGSDAYLLDGDDTVSDLGGADDLIVTEDSRDLTTPGSLGIEGVLLIGKKNSDVKGNSGDNRIIGNFGINKLSGGFGNDRLEGGKGDHLDGGDGNDTYIVNATRNGATKLKITELANQGTDVIETKVGYNIPLNVERLLLFGNSDLEIVVGNDQVNTITVFREGAAIIDGRGGADVISANFLGFSSGAVTISGGSGNDFVEGSDFDDVLYGHSIFIPAKDTFSDDDTILGGEGNDRIFAGKGADSVDGGNGNDYIHTLAKEASTFVGGLGNDTYEIAAGGIFNVLLIDESTGGGRDRIVSAVNVDLGAIRPSGLGGGTVVRGSIEIIELTGFAETATGDALDNTIFGNGSNNVLKGGLGKDTIYGGDGNDTLDGRDTITVVSFADLLYGGKGDDVYLITDTQDEVIETRDGQVRFLGTKGRAKGPDLSGRDRVESSVDFTLGAYVDDLFLTGTAVEGTGNSLKNLMRGSDFSNTLRGLAGDDTIYGGNGDDTMTGGIGKDTLFGQAGADVMEGGADNDTIEGNDGPDTIRGGGGNDFIFGQAKFTSGSEDNTEDNANDILFGDTGNDTIYGGGGNDVIDGGTGEDQLSGGAGDDLFHVDNKNDKVFEGVNAGTDEVRSSVSFTIPANVEKLFLTGNAPISATGSKGDEELAGNSGDNTISGLGGSDTIEGRGGRDQLFGGDGADYIWGDLRFGTGGDDDTLDGGKGDDFLIGGPGNDLYIVDSASDQVTEQPGEGRDRIEATVGFTAPLNVEDLIYVGPAKVGVALNGSATDNFISGGGGNDVLNGRGGTDTLAGGAGDDTYFVDSPDDRVTESEKGGTDKVFVLAGSYTLGDHVEKLVIIAPSGASASNGTGNSLANEIIGNSGSNLLSGMDGNDTIFGGGGADTFDGGAGNDTFIIEDRDVVIQEAELGGYDKAIVQVNNYILNPGAFVEEIQIAAIASVTGATGNDLANILIANNAGNGLNGGGGSDTLIGGNGEDYLTGTNLSGIGEIDVLTGGAGPDHFQLTTGVDLLYDDADANSAGRGDFAWIKDFKPADGDRITMAGGTSGRILFGSTLIFAGDAVVNGTGLFFDTDNDSVLDLTAPGAQDELIAFFEGTKIVPTVADIDFIFI